MKLIKKIYRFLGSVYLALALIFLAAIMVVAGTLIESLSDSHLLAAQWTYHHPSFYLLLWFFFINILFSALQRWPFQWRHLPFLITHLGLLMVIGGTLLKHKFGLQGHLSLLEGSTSHFIEIPYSHALLIKNKRKSLILPIDSSFSFPAHAVKVFPGLQIKIKHAATHVQENSQSWIKGKFASIVGQTPFIMQKNSNAQASVEFKEVHFENDKQKWDLVALDTDDYEESIKHIYFTNLTAEISHKINPEKNFKLTLKHPITNNKQLDKKIFTDLILPTSLLTSTSTFPFLIFKSNFCADIKIFLNGPLALYNLSFLKDTAISDTDYTVDLCREKPILAIIKNKNDAILVFFDKYGRFFIDVFSSQQLKNINLYNQGYEGYTVSSQVPFPNFNTSRKAKEKSVRKKIEQELSQIATNSETLALPFKLFKAACEDLNIDFAENFMLFLDNWNKFNQVLFVPATLISPLDKILQQIDWQQIENDDFLACQWSCLLYERLKEHLNDKTCINPLISSDHLPFNDEKDTSFTTPLELFNFLFKKIFSNKSQLPSPPYQIASLPYLAQLFSAYCKSYSINEKFIQQCLIKHDQALNRSEFEIFEEFQNWQPTYIESSYENFLTYLTPIKKLEELTPALSCEFKQNDREDAITLAYNPLGLKWPILDGAYLVRYQNQKVKIPYHVRLRQAREICYPQTQQTYSYECDLLFTNENGQEISKTLSMNTVYETWEGHRFYLSGLKTLANGLKFAQIEVNYDPAKYLFTYPGIFLIFLGSILLFWFKKSK